MYLKQAIARTLDRMGYKIVRSATARTVSRPDVVDSKPGRTLLPAENKPPRRCTTLAPPPATGSISGRLASHVGEFHEKGITVVPTNPELARTWRESEKFEDGVGNRHQSWEWAGNSIRPYSTHLRTGLPSPRLIEDLVQLFSSSDFDSFFRGVLGCPVSIGNCRLVRSIPHGESGVGPQSWHHDGCPPGVFRGVLYLSDVDAESGPFQYRDDAGREHEVLGKTGDLLVFDAMRLEHRATPPKTRVRSAIDLVFMPRLPTQEFQVNVAGMNHWPADPFAFAEPRAVS
jgi:hypothetical protein